MSREEIKAKIHGLIQKYRDAGIWYVSQAELNEICGRTNSHKDHHNTWYRIRPDGKEIYLERP
jgi:hypothetical protein